METDEKFKFGPSGPYSCRQKLRFCIQDETNYLWVDVALVKAGIPMLLGNNFLKPLGAKIKQFPDGNGVLRMKDTSLPLRGTSGGHYTIKVEDLGKLCDCSTVMIVEKDLKGRKT